jgi:uncharacterized membrane protein YqiK
MDMSKVKAFHADLRCPYCGHSPLIDEFALSSARWKEEKAVEAASATAEAAKAAAEAASSMARTVKEYSVIVTYPDESEHDLARRVNEAIAQGWEPMGAISATRVPLEDGSGWTTTFSQAMVRRS